MSGKCKQEGCTHWGYESGWCKVHDPKIKAQRARERARTKLSDKLYATDAKRQQCVAQVEECKARIVNLVGMRRLDEAVAEHELMQSKVNRAVDLANEVLTIREQMWGKKA